MKQEVPTRQRVKNLTLVAIAGQAGCVTLIIVLVALLLGLWLDSQFGRRGPCIVGMLILSVPVSLFAMLRITLGAINLMQTRLENHDSRVTKEQEH